MMQDYRTERELKRRVELEVAVGQATFTRDTVKALLAAWRAEHERLHTLATELKRICRKDADVREAHEVIATWQPIFAREGWMLDNVAAILDDWENAEVEDGS
jgi:hypothetical protein